MKKIGIIGGSGLDDPDILKNPEDISVESAYGPLASPVRRGRIGGHEVFLIARHGREHTVPPTQVNYRGMIDVLKKLECSYVLSTTAVGSLREDICRGDLVVLDQFIDFTRRRIETYYDRFEPHAPKHTPMAEPFSGYLRGLFNKACEAESGVRHHAAGTVITIEGPRFSTRAESRMFRMWGADVINMTIAPEAILANEAGLPYATVAMSTDYDCWKTDEAPVSWQEVLKIFNANVAKVTNVLLRTIDMIS